MKIIEGLGSSSRFKAFLKEAKDQNPAQRRGSIDYGEALAFPNVVQACEAAAKAEMRLGSARAAVGQSEAELLNLKAQVVREMQADPNFESVSQELVLKAQMRLDGLSKVVTELESIYVDSLKAIASERINIHLALAAEIRKEIVGIQQATRPLFDKLRELEGCEYAPLLQGTITRGAHQVRSIFLEEAEDTLLRNSKEGPHWRSQGEEIYELWKEKKTGSRTLLGELTGGLLK